MSDRLENLLGALVLAVWDSLSSAAETAAGHPGALAAGLAVLAQDPGLGIEQLKRQLGRTQAGTGRGVDQPVAARAAGCPCLDRARARAMSQLHRQLGRPQPPPVRVVDQLVAEGRAERRAGH